MTIQLSDHFTYKKLIRFVLPSIIMMIISSIYGVIDGLFVSNFVGKTPFAAVNFIMPLLMGLGVVGFMIGSGGAALVSKTLGEGDNKKANGLFSMLIVMTVCGGIVLTIIGFVALRPIAMAMGATGELLENCIVYGKIMLVGQTAFMLQNVFQSLFAVAEKPKLGLFYTVSAGLTDVILDALFIAVFKWGIAGAAFATIISQMVGGIAPLIYFAGTKSGFLRLTKPTCDFGAMLKVCTNGSSEMLTNIAGSLVSILYNLQLIKIAGENGIAAYGVIMYVNYIFLAIFIGYTIGSAPIFSYHYGAENYAELKNLLKKSLGIMGIFAVMLTFLAQVLAVPLSKTFVGYDAELLDLTIYAFRIFALSFLFCGFNIFGSRFFTALNNGFISACIAFARALIFPAVAVFVLPMIWQTSGIWLAVTFAELFALIITVTFLITQRKKYQYL